MPGLTIYTEILPRGGVKWLYQCLALPAIFLDMCWLNSVGSCSRVSCHEGASLGAITCEQPLGPANPYNRPEGFLYQKGRRPLGFHSAWEKDARKSLSESLQASDDCRGWGRCQGHLGQKPHLSLWHSPRRSWSSPSKFQDWEADLTTTKKKVSGTTAINRTLMFSGILNPLLFFLMEYTGCLFDQMTAEPGKPVAIDT